MLFKFAWTHTPEARDETVKKFMATGGMPPDGVECPASAPMEQFSMIA